jgi:hypothetical protein
MKICSKCKEEKDENEFDKNRSSKDGYGNQCKQCMKETKKQYYEENKEILNKKHKEYCNRNKEEMKEKKKQYYIDNKERINEREKKCNELNKEKIIERKKQYYEENKEILNKKHKEYNELNKEKIIEQKKQYYEENKEHQLKKVYERAKVRYKTDTMFYKKKIIRHRFREGMKRYSRAGKVKPIREYGIDIEKCGEYIGEQPGENYHIDHIIPLSFFNFDDDIEIQAAFLPINHQWLDAKENIRKSNKILNDEKTNYVKQKINEFLIQNGREPKFKYNGFLK